MDDVRPWCRVTVVDPEGVAVARFMLEGRGAPDIGAVDEVARLALLARRIWGGVVLADLSPALHALLELSGLRVEVEGQTKLGEEPLGVQEGQEEGHSGDFSP